MMSISQSGVIRRVTHLFCLADIADSVRAMVPDALNYPVIPTYLEGMYFDYQWWLEGAGGIYPGRQLRGDIWRPKMFCLHLGLFPPPAAISRSKTFHVYGLIVLCASFC